MKPQEPPQLHLDPEQRLRLSAAVLETQISLLAAVRREAENADSPDGPERALALSRALENLVDWRRGGFGFSTREVEHVPDPNNPPSG